MLKTRGFNHIDLGTKDMEATRHFYEDVCGFPLVRADLIDIVGKGTMKHFFFDCGHGQLMGFMSGEDVNGYPKDFDSGISSALRRACTTSRSTPRPRRTSTASSHTSRVTACR